MLTSIVGLNSSGKTLKLDSMFYECVGNKVYINKYRNFNYKVAKLNIIMSDEDLDILEDKLDVKITNNIDSLTITYFEKNNSYSDEFILLIKLLYSDIDYIFIDEPEVDISYNEKLILCDIMCIVGNKKEIIYTTHSYNLNNIADRRIVLGEYENVKKMLL